MILKEHKTQHRNMKNTCNQCENENVKKFSMKIGNCGKDFFECSMHG